MILSIGIHLEPLRQRSAFLPCPDRCPPQDFALPLPRRCMGIACLLVLLGRALVLTVAIPLMYQVLNVGTDVEPPDTSL